MSRKAPLKIYPDDEYLIIDALRYSRGRGTGVVEDTCRWIGTHWHQLSANTRSVIARDVQLEIELRRDDTTELGAMLRQQMPHWEALLDTIEGDTPCSKP